MKQLLLLTIMLASGIMASAQKPVINRDSLMDKARIMTMEKSRHYNPQGAMAIYQQKATEGNAEAMNAIGMLYCKGIGTTANSQEGLKWIKKSAKAGYAKAWYNLGLMYKNGVGTDQNFAKAFECFRSGADLNNRKCLFEQGYMLYKGFGCGQDYIQSFQFFSKGAKTGEVNCMYFKGICFRNGYGINLNLDSARFWLTKAAKFRHKGAIQELENSKPENTGIKNPPSLGTASSSQQESINIKKGYRKVSQQVPLKGIDGEYKGYAITFDWSGKHIVSTSELKLRFQSKDGKISAEWQEEGGAVENINGTLTDSSFMFKDAVISSYDHYNKNTPNVVRMENAYLQVSESEGQSVITGNIKRYSVTHKEPEKPMFVMLISNKADVVQSPLPNNEAELDTDSIKFKPYPNPFTNSFSVEYSLKQQSMVRIYVSDVLTGKIVYSSNPQLMEAGEHTKGISIGTPMGYYVVTLNYGDKLKSAIVYKN